MILTPSALSAPSRRRSADYRRRPRRGYRPPRCSVRASAPRRAIRQPRGLDAALSDRKMPAFAPTETGFPYGLNCRDAGGVIRSDCFPVAARCSAARHMCPSRAREPYRWKNSTAQALTGLSGRTRSSARCTAIHASGMTTRPPPGSRPRAVTAVFDLCVTVNGRHDWHDLE